MIDKNLTNGKKFVQKVIVNDKYEKHTKNGVVYTNEFAVILAHEDIINILNLNQSEVAFFNTDATGSLVKSPTCCGKNTHNQSAILNYNIIMRVNGTTYPVVEMISSMGNSDALTHMFDIFKSILEKAAKEDFKPKNIVLTSDWAAQNFNSSILVFNKTNLIDHINNLYTDKNLKSKLQIFPYNCCSHFVHAISRYCNNHLLPHQLHLKNLIIQIFTSIMLAETIDIAFEIAYRALVIFFCVNSSPTLIQQKRQLLKVVSQKEILNVIKKCEEEPQNSVSFNENEPEPIEKNSRDNSLLYQRFLQIARQAIDASKKYNSIFDSPPGNNMLDDQGTRGVLFKLLELKMGYLILWGTQHYKKFTNTRLSNATIESYHLQIKKGELSGVHPRRMSDYINIRQETLENKLAFGVHPKITNLLIHGKARVPAKLQKQTVNREEDELTDTFAEEKYMKKIKQPPPSTRVTHFDLIKLSQELSGKPLKDTDSPVNGCDKDALMDDDNGIKENCDYSLEQEVILCFFFYLLYNTFSTIICVQRYP